MATTHVMKVTPICGTQVLNNGYKLCMAEQVTDAAIADNDILSFPNCTMVIPINIASETGTTLAFDASAVSGTNWLLTDNVTTAATRCQGLVLARINT